MKLTKITVDTQQVQNILFNYGTTFERPVNLEKLAIEIYSSCKVIDITDNSEFQKNASFEVSYTNGN